MAQFVAVLRFSDSLRSFYKTSNTSMLSQASSSFLISVDPANVDALKKVINTVAPGSFAAVKEPSLGPLALLMMFLFSIFVGFMTFQLLNAARFRFKNVKDLKKRHGFTDDPETFMSMSPKVAQEVYFNLAQHDFPFLFELGWLLNFFKTATAPCLSKVIVDSGHFTNQDQATSHARQQDTICLMTAMMAQPFHTMYHALAIARINEHHNRYGKHINSDTVLWLSEMWMEGPVQWINLLGWRQLQPFEIQAMFVLWRELSVMIGCKWVPNTLKELQVFRAAYVLEEQRPSKYNVIFSDAIMDAILFILPNFLKNFGRKAVIAILDEDVRYCNKYTAEFSPHLRTLLLHTLRFLFGTLQLHLCLPRATGRDLTPLHPNPSGTFNFPAYTFYATPYYVAPTFLNSRGLMSLLNKYWGLPVASSRWGGDGVNWESMGAKLGSVEAQGRAEKKVRAEAEMLVGKPFGYRAKVGFEGKSIVVDKGMGKGYGDGKGAYTEEELGKKGPTVTAVEE